MRCGSEELFDVYADLHDIEEAVKRPLLMASELSHMERADVFRMYSAVHGSQYAEEMEGMRATSRDTTALPLTLLDPSTVATSPLWLLRWTPMRTRSLMG